MVSVTIKVDPTKGIEGIKEAILMAGVKENGSPEGMLLHWTAMQLDDEIEDLMKGFKK